ncbi:MAG: twin-arginine translocation signal domain-containing protein [Verrucomicrobia bacterium]|nr:twin-arginine translocation signal domain-containing protein [Verrucomicrobiota bacterium]
MHTQAYLFPHRLTRRDFLKLTGTAAAGLAAPGSVSAAEPPAPVRIGSGPWTYTLDESWGKLPPGMHYGFGCGVVLDAKGRVYVTSRSTNPCVAIFDRDGTLLETWSNDFAEKVGYTTAQVADTAHCLYWSQEGPDEFIYWTENVSTNKEGPKLGKRVYKTDLRGKILYEIGNVQQEGSTAQKFDWTNPTDVAVAPNGDIYVVDGYGSQRVSHFDKHFRHLRTIGRHTAKNQIGPDAPHGTFNTCHGIWISTLHDEPEAYIADRHNDRIEVFDLDLNYKRTLKGDVRNPCCLYQHAGHLYVPDLASRVTIFDGSDRAVAQLGDGKGVPNGSMGVKPDVAAQNPDKFFAPHAMTVDARGDLYVVEWVSFGRPRKFRHTPMA